MRCLLVGEAALVAFLMQAASPLLIHAQESPRTGRIVPVAATAEVNLLDVSARESKPLTRTRRTEGEAPAQQIPALPRRAQTGRAANASAAIGGTDGGPAPALSASFLGTIKSFGIPDTQGAVGPNHVVMALNDGFIVQTRAGATVTSTALAGFWAGLANGAYDPRISYDPLSGRWITIALDNNLLIAVSDTNDPSGSWFQQKINAESGKWLDFPALAFTKDWIAVVVNVWNSTPQQYVETRLYLFTKADLYGRLSSPPRVFSLTGWGRYPVTSYDGTLSKLYLATPSYGWTYISTITGTPGAEVYTPNVGSFYSGSDAGSNGGAQQLPQSGTTSKITNRSGASDCAYRNGALWCAAQISLPAAAPTRQSVEWFQLDPESGIYFQIGRVDDPTGIVSYSLPSIGVSKNNDVMIGYSSFSANRYASANFAFRYGTDPPGKLRTDTIYKPGADVFICPGCNATYWGDYTATVPDPLDNLSIWTLQEYAESLSGGYSRYGLWWGKVTPPDAAPCQATLTSGVNTLVATGGVVTVTIKAPANCSWTVFSSASWLTPNGSASGTGDGLAAFMAETHYLPASRSAVLAVSPQSKVGLTQLGTCDLTLVKSPSGRLVVGSKANYNLTVTNSGQSPTTGTIFLQDSLPAGLSFSSASGTGWSCSAVQQNVNCTRPTALEAGASTTVILTVNVGAAAFPTVMNMASVAVAGDYNSSNNAAQSQTPVDAMAQPVSVAPASGTAMNGTIVFRFSASNAYTNLGVANILVNNFLDGRHACYLAYDSPSNVLYLMNDAGTALLPGLVLSGSGSVGNSQCIVNGVGSSASGGGDVLTLTLNMSFTPGFGGNKVVYMAARNLPETFNSGWHALGVWKVPGGAAANPSVGSVTPGRITGLRQTLTVTFNDTAGYQDLGVMNVLINDFLNGDQACYIAYSRPAQVLYLVNDGGPGSGLSTGLTLGSAGTVSNSQCTIYGATSSVSGNGNMLTLTLDIGTKASFAGDRVIYTAARTVAEANSGWQALGSWSVP